MCKSCSTVDLSFIKPNCLLLNTEQIIRHKMDHDVTAAVQGLFAFRSWVFSLLGAKVPIENFRSRERKFSGTFAPRNESSRELLLPGTFVPRNFRTRDSQFAFFF